MSAFKNVAVFGVSNTYLHPKYQANNPQTGFLSSALVPQLTSGGFQVTLMSRKPCTTDLPTGVVSKVVDYSSVDNLVTALQGQDVVIASLAMPALLVQTTLIEAAIKAGVRRFIPSDFGALTTRPAARDLPLHQNTNLVQDLLKDKAASGELEYTLVSPGMFLEYVLGSPLIIDLKGHAVSLYDGGEHAFSTSSISTIAKAVVAALKKPEATKNRILSINDVKTTQSDLLRIAKKHSAGTEWKETSLDSQAEFTKALENAKLNPTEPTALFPILQAAVLGGRFDAAYNEIDNELLGLPTLSSEELEAKVAAAM